MFELLLLEIFKFYFNSSND